MFKKLIKVFKENFLSHKKNEGNVYVEAPVTDNDSIDSFYNGSSDSFMSSVPDHFRYNEDKNQLEFNVDVVFNNNITVNGTTTTTNTTEIKKEVIISSSEIQQAEKLEQILQKIREYDDLLNHLKNQAEKHERILVDFSERITGELD